MCVVLWRLQILSAPYLYLSTGVLLLQRLSNIVTVILILDYFYFGNGWCGPLATYVSPDQIAWHLNVTPVCSGTTAWPFQTGVTQYVENLSAVIG